MEVKLKQSGDDGLEQELITTAPSIFAFAQPTTHYKIFLDQTITEPALYRNEITALLTMQEGDSVDLLINCKGGNVAAARAVLECLKSTPATTRAIIMGYCYSAATFLALACDEIIVTDAAEFMIHTASFGTEGTTALVKSHSDFVIKQVHKLLDETYEGLLTQKEIDAVKNGTEFWFSAEELRVRLENRAKYLAKKNKQGV